MASIRDRIGELPLPLAQLVRRALNGKAAVERHNNAFYLCECALKLSAAARIGVWLEHGLEPGSPIAKKLEGLMLPSLGHWCEYLREVSRELGERPDAALLPFARSAGELTKKRPEWEAVRAFGEQGVKEGVIGEEVARGARSRGALGFFELVVAYRNEVVGHGAQRAESFYDTFAHLLLDAAGEVLTSPAAFDGLQLAKPRAEATKNDGPQKLQWYALTGLAGLPLDVPAPARVTPGQLYFVGGGEAVSLHPLVVYCQEDELGREQVGFLNRTVRRTRQGATGPVEEVRRCDHLDYASGEPIDGIDARAALAGLLSKLRGRAVGDSDVDAAANATMSGTKADASEIVVARGAVLGDYLLLGELGRGAMGVVYKAKQMSLGRVVALKVLPPAMSADKTASKRFKKEIEALARCEHPNVVKILASGADGERMYYAMEHVEGADLAAAFAILSSWKGKGDRLREGHLSAAITSRGAQNKKAEAEDADDGMPSVATIPPPSIVSGRSLSTRLAELFADAADGLAHLHANGILHRDLKPSNLMLTRDGRRIVIMDLGLAKLRDESRQLTSTDVKILGTLRYMSPEQLQRKLLDVDERADIYSLGAALYELATGQPLFDGDTEQRLIQQVLNETPVSPLKIEPTIPRDLATVIEVALAKLPEHRYASAAAMAEDLRAVAANRPIAAKPPGVGHRLGLWLRRNGGGRAVAVAIAALCVLAPLVFVGARQVIAAHQCIAGDLDECTAQCNRAHVGSCYALGQMYENGQGAPRDQTRAVGSYARACEGHYAAACFNLGFMLDEGRGGPRDPAAAVRRYTEACDYGAGQGCNALAVKVLDHGAQADFAQALSLFRKACDSGFAQSCGNVGLMYEQGRGLAKDDARARGYYDSACKLGALLSCAYLGRLFEEGRGAPRDEERAIGLYRRACEGGAAFGCSSLGVMLEEGRGVPEKDPAKAADAYRTACENKAGAACANLARLYTTGSGVPKDLDRADVYLRAGCEHKNAEACGMLAESRSLLARRTGFDGGPAQATKEASDAGGAAAGRPLTREAIRAACNCVVGDPLCSCL